MIDLSAGVKGTKAEEYAILKVKCTEGVLAQLSESFSLPMGIVT